MGIEALSHDDAGQWRQPGSDLDWQEWVSAGRTRHFILDDPLLDWLELYGRDHGFLPDNEQPGYDPRTDFGTFLFRQGNAFEAAVVSTLSTGEQLRRIASGPGEIRDPAAAQATFEAMSEGVPMIHQGVLHDPQHRTYGAPDLLVRSDVLHRLFPGAISAEEAALPAPGLGAATWHYRVLDIKFTTLHLAATGVLANEGSGKAYKSQLYIYNQALGRLQGFEPETAYLLGRGWHQVSRGGGRGSSCLERLAPVKMDSMLTHHLPLGTATAVACDWIRELRRDGAGWRVTPRPSRPELYPNAGHVEDAPWHAAKREIAHQLQEITQLWQVGVTGRRQAHEAGVFSWRDPACTPTLLGVTGERNPIVLAEMLDINRDLAAPPVRPSRIAAAEAEWRQPASLEFYVDFETVTDLNDDFASLPQRGGQPLIFMIGCGHMEAGEWRFACFITPTLTEACEAELIDDWFKHMDDIRRRLIPDGPEPRLYHWSQAETSSFETAYNSAVSRHPGKAWPSPAWFDFLTRVIKEEPVVVRGALGFGLKAVARALHSHSLIETVWQDGPADGLGAMVGAWWCQEEATRTGAGLADIDLMQDIRAYNEVDCRVMMEAVRYLRQHH